MAQHARVVVADSEPADAITKDNDGIGLLLGMNGARQSGTIITAETVPMESFRFLVPLSFIAVGLGSYGV